MKKILLLIVFLAAGLDTSSVLAERSPYSTTEYLFSSCKNVKTEDVFSGSFCNGYILAFFRGYMVGLIDKPPVIAKKDGTISEADYHTKFCFSDTKKIPNEYTLATDFVRWIDDIPDDGNEKRFMQEDAATNFLNFLSIRYPCK